MRSQRRIRAWVVRKAFLEEECFSRASNGKWFCERGGLSCSRRRDSRY
jgi:hypothetical protein